METPAGAPSSAAVEGDGQPQPSATTTSLDLIATLKLFRAVAEHMDNVESLRQIWADRNDADAEVATRAWLYAFALGHHSSVPAFFLSLSAADQVRLHDWAGTLPDYRNSTVPGAECRQRPTIETVRRCAPILLCLTHVLDFMVYRWAYLAGFIFGACGII